jgi:hypothetical protein
VTDPIAKRQRAKQACPIGGEHAWQWAENVQQPATRAKRLTVTTKGFYQCPCGATQMGPKQRQPPTSRKKPPRSLPPKPATPRA